MPQIYGSSLPNYAAKFATSKTFAPSTAFGGPRYGGKTVAEGGVSPAASAAQKSEESWKTAQDLLLRQGPYTPEVTQQLTNRRADQTAAIEAINSEDIRNQAAARGLDPTQALRQQQAQRQQSNVAFQGDIASQAAIQNFAAETPGRMAAAQANLQRSFTGGSTPAVTGGGMRATTAFAPQSSGYNPGSVHQQALQQPMAWGASKLYGSKASPSPAPAVGQAVLDRNAAQAAWDKSTNYGRDVYGPTHQPGAIGTGRDPKTGALIGGIATKPDLRAASTAFTPPQGGYAAGRQYGSVQTYGY